MESKATKSSSDIIYTNIHISFERGEAREEQTAGENGSSCSSARDGNEGKTNVLQGSCYHGTAFTHAVDDRSSNRTEPRCTSSPSSAYFSLRQQQTHGDGCCSRTTFHTHTNSFSLKSFSMFFFFWPSLRWSHFYQSLAVAADGVHHTRKPSDIWMDNWALIAWMLFMILRWWPSKMMPSPDRSAWESRVTASSVVTPACWKLST